MNDIKPPWGYSEDPWKEIDLFQEWVIEKDLKAIDVTDTLTLIELFGLCTETFEVANPPIEFTTPIVDMEQEAFLETGYLQDLG
jgi:hypothetical protein